MGIAATLTSPALLPAAAERAKAAVDALAESFASHAITRLMPDLGRRGLSAEQLRASGREGFVELLGDLSRGEVDAYISRVIARYEGMVSEQTPLENRIGHRYGDYIHLHAAQKLALLHWMGTQDYDVATVLTLVSEVESFYCSLENAYAEAYARKHEGRLWIRLPQSEGSTTEVEAVDEEGLKVQLKQTMALTGSLEQIMDTSLLNLCRLLHAKHGVVWLWDEEARGLQIKSHYNLAEADVPAVNEAYRHRTSESPVIEAFHGQEIIAYPDALGNLAHASRHHLAVWLEFRGALYAPLVYQGRAIGTLSLLFHEIRHFTPKELRLLALFSHQLAMAVSEAWERERTQRVHEEQIEYLKQVDELKDEFLNVLSHELRTSLVSVFGFGSMLEDGMAGPLTERQLDYLHRMLGGADTLLKLINDLLDMSRIQAGKFSISPLWSRLEELAEVVLEKLRPLADERQHRIVVDFAPDLPDLWGDPQRISQVLSHLVTNALKFTPNGGTITLRGRADDDHLLCEVSDTGVGIPQKDLPKVFRRFTQLDGSSTRKEGGVGLGLSISKALIEAHGGTIGVHSDPGKGSTFWFRMPLNEQ